MSSILPWNQSLIVIPTFNEIDNVGKMVARLFELYPEVHLLIVEDNSPDGTAEVVKKLQEKHPRLFMLERRGKLGLASAYIEGFHWALARDYQFVFEMDCDFSHDPAQVCELLTAAKDCDLVIGGRYKGGIRVINWPLHRLLLSYLANVYIRLVTGIPVWDATGGFKCFTRKALMSLDLGQVFSRGYIFQFELTYKIWVLGLSVVEVPIVFSERRDGQSKMGGGIIFEALFAVLRLRFKQLSGTLFH